MPAKKKEEPKKAEAVRLKKMPTKTVALEIEAYPGSPLVVNNLRGKHNISMMQRRLRGMSTSNKGRIRDPIEEFHGARYVVEDGLDGVPTHGIKLAICSALQFYSDIDLTMAKARRVIQVNIGQDLTPIRYKPSGKQLLVFESEAAASDDGKKPEPFYEAEIEKGLPVIREDIVRLQGATKAPDLRYRPQYDDWSAKILVSFKPAIITEESIANLVQIAGEMIGLCEWRPEKGGSWGMFRIKRPQKAREAA